jgi:RNA polymerase sigma factor (sigma-70 family)
VQPEPSVDVERFVLERSTALLRTAVRWRTLRQHPEPYVRRVLVNLARDRWRQAARRVGEHELDEAAHVVSGRDPAQTVVDRDALRRALAALPRRQREVVVLRFFADLSVAETAALRTTEGTVKADTSRAVARLRAALGEEVAEDVHGHG